MSPTNRNRLVVIGGVLVLATGTIDAAIGGQWDLFVVVLVALVLELVLLIGLESRRPAVPVRRDLVVWLRDRAAVGGEPLSVLVDRALAAYRDRYGQARPAPAEPPQ